MFKKLGLIFSWFTAVPLLLVISTLIFANKNLIPRASLVSHKPNQETVVKVAAVNSVAGQVLGERVDDLRPLKVENFLKNTPLKPFGNYLVEVADKYDLDYRWIPAIAMKETGGGKTAPVDSFNAWGFENGRTKFASWEQAIDSVGKTLKSRYIDRGLTTPEQIMPIYAPPAIANGGGWAVEINNYFAKIEKF